MFYKHYWTRLDTCIFSEKFIPLSSFRNHYIIHGRLYRVWILELESYFEKKTLMFISDLLDALSIITIMHWLQCSLDCQKWMWARNFLELDVFLHYGFFTFFCYTLRRNNLLFGVEFFKVKKVIEKDIVMWLFYHLVLALSKLWVV